MHLAKLKLDPRLPQARRDVADAYQMHRTLCRAFVDGDTDTPARFLWRLESPATGDGADQVVVLVQSARPGNWQGIEERSGYQLAGEKEVDLGHLLAPGRLFHFRLNANPTVTRAGKRFGLVGEEAQQAWLLRQGERCGFRAGEAVITAASRLVVKQPGRGHRITVDCVRFDGVLEAKDTDAMGGALVQGIGHAKALGLGLLSLAPLQR